MVYQSKDLKEVHQVPLDQSPTILIPYYDQDSNTLFVTGKVRLLTQRIVICGIYQYYGKNQAISNNAIVMLIFYISNIG